MTHEPVAIPRFARNDRSGSWVIRIWPTLVKLCALFGTIALTTDAAAAQQPAPCDVFCHSRLAARAEAAGNIAEHVAHVRAVAAIAPSHPAVVHAMARAFALAGSPDSAIAWLDRLGRMGDNRDPNADSAFRSLRSRRRTPVATAATGVRRRAEPPARQPPAHTRRQGRLRDRRR